MNGLPPEPAPGADAHVRRIPVVVALTVVLVAALVAGDAERALVVATDRSSDAVALPPAGTRSAAWYCSGLPPSGPLAEANDYVYLTNVGDTDAVADVTVLADGGRPARRQVEVPARSVTGFPRSDVSAGPGAIVVEPFSPDVVVEQAIGGGGAFAVDPCATQPSAQWYFAAGTTARGIEQWLLVVNPFGDDAIIDVTFLTDVGVRKPEDLHGLAVPRRSRVAIPVHEQAIRQARVATIVEARVGRVVAAQSLVFLADSGRQGFTRSLGAVSPALEWWFTDGESLPSSRRRITIANPGTIDTEVDVLVVPSDDLAFEPRTVSVPRQATVWVQIGGCGEESRDDCVPVPARVAYDVYVSAGPDIPVVVEDFSLWSDEDAFTGAATSLGTSEPAAQWVFGRSRFKGQTDAYLALVNTTGEVVHASITFVRDGEVVAPAELGDVELPPSRRVVVSLTDIDALDEADAGIVIEADGALVAERVVVKESEVTRAPGVPVRAAANSDSS